MWGMIDSSAPCILVMRKSARDLHDWLQSNDLSPGRSPEKVTHFVPHKLATHSGKQTPAIVVITLKTIVTQILYICRCFCTEKLCFAYLKNKLVKCYIWSIALYGSETWILRKLERKYLESFEMWRWKRMAKIKSSEKVTNEQVLEHF